jgi:hypothetical protein
MAGRFVPELDLVVEFLGGNHSDRVLYVPQREYVPNYILPSVVPSPTGAPQSQH